MNSSFAYINPYSQTSQNAASWQHQLRVFQQAAGGQQPSLESLQRLYHHLQQLQSTRLDWSVTTARKFNDYCLRLVLDQQQDVVGCMNPSPVLPSLLYVMVKAMEQSDESLTYAIVMGEQHSQARKENETLLDIYQDLFFSSSSSSSPSAISLVACVGLAVAFRSLDRLERFTSLQYGSADTTWWLSSAKTKLAAIAVELLLRNELDYDLPTTQPFPTLEEIQKSCAAILSALLKHNMTEWLFALSDDQRQQLCQRLKCHADRLSQNDRSMSPSLQSLQLSMVCVGLLFLISWKHLIPDLEQWNVQWSNDMGQHIVRVAFPGTNTTPRGPRWTNESPATIRLLQPWAQELLLVCKICGVDSLWTALESRQWLPFWETSWNKVLEQVPSPATNHKDLNLDDAFCLYLIQPQVTRSALVNLLDPESVGLERMVPACRRLVDALLPLCNSPNVSVAGPATAFLRFFLSDNLNSPDELTRALWEGLQEEQLVDSFQKLALAGTPVEQQAVVDDSQPQLLMRLDLLGELVVSPERCRIILRRLGAQHAENLIHIMSPKDARLDLTNSFDDTQPGMNDEDTPPANNLSRLDERSIYVEQERQPKPRGLDDYIRFSAATFLARLACTTSLHARGGCDSLCADDATRIVQARVRGSVVDFISNLTPPNDSPGLTTTLDMTRRLFRLLVACDTKENEEFLVAAMHSAEMSRRHHCNALSEELQGCREFVKQAKARELAFEIEKKARKKEMNLKTMIFERETARCKQQASDDANQLVKVHAVERARAERNATELAKRLEEAGAAVNEAERRLQIHLRTENETKEALNAATLRIQELATNLHEHKQACADRESEAEQIASELESTSHLLSEAKEQQRLIQGHLDAKREELSSLRDSHTMLQDNLENLFADMVSLTQLYQFKEQEVTDAKARKERSVQDLKDQLDKERRRNEELERKEREARHENERLAKKLDRYKQRLESERRERQEESERRQKLGPISYMNQLHNSTYSDRSGKDKTRDKSFNSKKDSSRW